VCGQYDHPPYPPADAPDSVVTFHRARVQAQRMLRDQGAAVVTGGGLLCTECHHQQPKPGMLDASGRCAQCAP
jgi:hypothetical protein